MDWEFKIDISGQSNNCLRVCNVKMKKNLPGQKWGTFLRILQVMACSLEKLEFLFKMLKLDEIEFLESKMSDFE